MKNCLSFLFIMFYGLVQAQHTISSNTYIQTCVGKAQCSAISNASYLFYDENDNTLYLKVNFNDFKIANDSIYDWLDDLSNTHLYYKAHFPREHFRGLSSHENRVIRLNGQVYLNGIWHSQSLNITLFTTENSLLTRINNDNFYDNFKVNFSLSIAPKDYKIHKKPHHLRKTIFIGIALGRINLLQPGQTGLLGEAYRHH